MNTSNPQKPFYESPARLLFIIAVAVFLSEAIDMTVIYALRPFPSDLAETLFDSAFLLVMLSPILYFFLFRPLLLHIGERTRAEDALLKLNNQIKTRTKEMERQNTEISMLNKMGELLHACDTLDEAYSVIAHSVSQLFPEDSGALFILNSSRNLLEAVSFFGRPAGIDQVFPPRECWALRRGRQYSVEDLSAGLGCQHLKDSGHGHICLPLMAHGETLGVLHLLAGPSKDAPDKELQLGAKHGLLLRVAEHISIIVANLRLREILRNLSIRDSLTGLFNRRFMEESLEREYLRAKRSGKSLGIIMFDIDHFKQFNDVFGHDAGDALLRELGAFLKQNIRGSDIVCRYGGEEFIIIMPDTTMETVYQRAEYLREEAGHIQIQYNHQPLASVTLSLGVAMFPEHGLTVQAVVQAADAALYKAKESGRNKVCLAKEIAI